MPSPGPRQFLSVLLTTQQVGDRRWWIAQVLEYDISAQARTLPAAKKEIQRVIAAHVASAKEMGLDDPFGGLQSAPREFWKMYEEDSDEPSEAPFELVVADLSGPWLLPNGLRLRVA